MNGYPHRGKRKKGRAYRDKMVIAECAASHHTRLSFGISFGPPNNRSPAPFGPKSRCWISGHRLGFWVSFSLLMPVVWVEDGVDMSQPLSNQRLSPPTFQAFVALKLGLLFRQDIIHIWNHEEIFNCWTLFPWVSWKSKK